MARIIRCPSCGALWRLEGAAEENYLCSACGREFSAASAQTVEVDDQALDATLAELKAKKSEAAQAAPRQPMTEPRFATKVAQELNTPTTAEKNEPPAQFDEKEAGRGAPMPAIYRTKKSGLGSFLLCAAVGAACAFLMMHQFVLSQAPYVRPVYEKVCRSLPCPGFVWTDASAFKAKATLAPDETLGLAKPTAVVELTNTSEYPQMLPVIELKYLSKTFQMKDGAAGESLTAQIKMEGTLSFAATAAQVKPVVDAGR